MVDLITATRAIVLPAIEAVFREREVATIELRASSGSLHLSLTVEGETFHDEVVQAGVPDQSPEDWRERLRSNLADFVAESRFGWGQSRDQGL
jgi:hypothetical protein